MQSTTGRLVEHLAAKGVPLDRIAAFVGELGSMIAEEPSIPIHEMERTMHARGWEGFDLDERTYLLTLLVVVETLTESGPETGLWSDRPVTLRILLN
jgi:hypothetical protein